MLSSIQRALQSKIQKEWYVFHIPSLLYSLQVNDPPFLGLLLDSLPAKNPMKFIKQDNCKYSPTYVSSTNAVSTYRKVVSIDMCY